MGIEVTLVVVRKDKLTRMPDFMNQGIDIAQTACPAHEDIRVHMAGFISLPQSYTSIIQHSFLAIFIIRNKHVSLR